MSNTSRFCHVCGSGIGPHASFCSHCGASLTSHAATPSRTADISRTAGTSEVLHPEQLAINCPTLPKGAFRSCVTWWLINTIIAIPCFIGLLVFDPNSETALVLASLVGISIFGILGTISYFKFLYRCWRLIQDGHAHTTPGKAVGFCFIPIFNIYWVFIAVYCLAKDLNAYASRYAIAASRASEGLVLTTIIIGFIPYGCWLNIFFAIPALYSMAKTAEAIQDARRE